MQPSDDERAQQQVLYEKIMEEESVRALAKANFDHMAWATVRLSLADIFPLRRKAFVIQGSRMLCSTLPSRGFDMIEGSPSNSGALRHCS